MVYAEKTTRAALIVGGDSSVERLNRVPYMTGEFNEKWLQDLIANNPFILPASEISSEYASPICIGTEVPVGFGDTKGFVDNLYVTPTGNIIIVETKLFRNQESRRTVVAQIIDYAKEIQKWDCTDLDRVAADYTLREEGQSFRLIDLMAKHGYLTFSDESRFTDRVNENLKNASFLLMVVGDGIRSSVQELADFLNENTSMSFNLALCEMEIYQHEEETIVIPNLLTKTIVIERRTPFVFRNRENAVSTKQSEKKPILSRKEFINVFSNNGGYDPDEIGEFVSLLESVNGITVGIQPTELTLRFSPEDGYSYALITLGISGNHADLYVMPKRIKDALARHHFFPFDADDFLEFYKQFVDIKRCKTPPYEYEEGFYYADIDKVLRRNTDFFGAVEQFSIKLSKYK